MNDDNYKKWEKCGMLRGIEDKENLVLCLEGQRLYGQLLEKVVDSKTTRELRGKFRRISVPIMRRVFEKLSKQNIKLIGCLDVLDNWTIIDIPDNDQFFAWKQNIFPISLDFEAEVCLNITEYICNHILSLGIKQLRIRCFGLSDNNTVFMNYEFIKENEPDDFVIINFND
jgi:hypothetical protein